MADQSTEIDDRWRDLRMGAMPNYDFDGLHDAAREYLGETTAASIMRYVMRGVDPGHFLTCVLANDLVHSFGQADEHNLLRMRTIAAFLYNEMPMNCWGSYTTVNHWMKNGGAFGFRKKLKDEFNEEHDKPYGEQGNQP